MAISRLIGDREAAGNLTLTARLAVRDLMVGAEQSGIDFSISHKSCGHRNDEIGYTERTSRPVMLVSGGNARIAEG